MSSSEAVRVFVSYRRVDEPDFCSRLFDRLVLDFGEGNVFRDIDSIPAGADVTDVINQRLAQVDVVVALVGDTWANWRTDTLDFIQLELSTALRMGKPIVPVLLKQSEMPPVAMLAPGLAPIAGLNRVRIRPDPDFIHDFQKVVADARVLVAGRREDQRRFRAELAEGRTELARLAAERVEVRQRIAHAEDEVRHQTSRAQEIDVRTRELETALADAERALMQDPSARPPAGSGPSAFAAPLPMQNDAQAQPPSLADGLRIMSAALRKNPPTAAAAEPVQRVVQTQAEPSPTQYRSGWYSDPTGRFQHRYHDGNVWTEHVAREGVRAVDPLQSR